MREESIDQQIRFPLFEERHVHAGGIDAAHFEHQEHARQHERHQHLHQKLAPAGQAEVTLLHDLGVIIGEADGRVCQQAEHRDPDVKLPQIGPEQGGNHDGDHDEHAAHGRRPRLFLMRFRAFLTDVLPDLKFAQLGYEPWSQRNAEKQRRKAGERSAERGVAKHTKRADVRKQLLVKKVIEHSLLPDGP